LDPTKKKSSPRAKRQAAPKDVDEYLAGVPEPARTTLKKVRAVIRSAAPPEAVETISYGIPALKHNGMLVWFAAFSDHCSFFPTAAVIRMFQDELKAFPIAKGTIRFPVDKPLPAGLLKRMVRARIAQNQKRQNQKTQDQKTQPK
jgi:uncharacterized protein YdhG (YjbR/CyaY superfamily)